MCLANAAGSWEEDLTIQISDAYIVIPGVFCIRSGLSGHL